MGCRLGRIQTVEENISRAHKRMEQIEKVFEVLTNDGRLIDIIEQINKNQGDINNKNVSLQQQEDKPTISENKI